MCVYTVLNKNKNAWIMHQDIPSQQSTALVSNITCHLQISPCWLFWGFVFRAKLFHHDNQTHLAVVCKKAAVFQLGKNSSELSFPFPLCFLTCSPFLLARRPAHGGKPCAWSTRQMCPDLLSTIPFWMRKPEERCYEVVREKNLLFFVRIQTVAYKMGH